MSKPQGLGTSGRGCTGSHRVADPANAEFPVRPATLKGRSIARPSTASRLRWLAARAGAMETGEAVERLRQAVRSHLDVVVERGRPPLRGHRQSTAFVEDAKVSPAVISRERADLIRAVMPLRADGIVAAAERYVAGEFHFLGYEPVALARPLRYDHDLITGNTWPKRHGLRLDYRTSSIGDPKWIWELNRLQHAPLLLQAWLLTEDERFRATAVEDIDSWLEQSKPGFGIAWSNGFEPGLRAISLALSLDALRTDPGIHASTHRRVVEALGHHIRWIRRYPSLHSSANNHRLGELAGIIVTAALVPELPLALARDEALLELRRRCEEQFAADGGHREQAFGYAVFCTDLLLLVAGALASTGGEVPQWLDHILHRSADALAFQLGDGEPEPRYGDCDDGRAAMLDGESERTGRSTCAALAARLGHRAARRTAGDLDPAALWLFGAEGEARFRDTHVIAPHGSGCMRDTGLVALRNGRTTVMFDVGCLGWGPLAAHGHADALQVTLRHGRDVLIGDPGTGSYFGSRVVRNAFRGTGFHATVRVDDVDQAVIAGPFLWKHAPVVELAAVDLEQRSATGHHTGYARLADPVSHVRSVVVLDEGLVLVRDVLEGTRPHRYSQRWPFPPGATVRLIDEMSLGIACGDSLMQFRVACSEPVELSIVEGSTDPFEGWWSVRLEAVTPAPLARVDVTASGSVEVVTALSVCDLSAEDPLDIELDTAQDGVIRVANAESEFVIEASPSGSLTVIRHSLAASANRDPVAS